MGLYDGVAGFHTVGGAPALSGLRAVEKAECEELFRNYPSLLRGSSCIDWFNFDLIHTLGNGICKRTLDAFVDLMKLKSPSSAVFKSRLKTLNKRLQSDDLLWGSSPSSGTPIRGVYKSLAKFKNVTCKEYMYCVQKLNLVLGEDEVSQFLPAEDHMRVRKGNSINFHSLWFQSTKYFIYSSCMKRTKCCAVASIYNHLFYLRYS